MPAALPLMSKNEWFRVGKALETELKQDGVPNAPDIVDGVMDNLQRNRAKSLRMFWMSPVPAVS